MTLTMNDILKMLRSQAAALADLGQYALTAPLDKLFDETVARLAQVLQVEYCKILKFLPDDKALLLVAGVGWQPGLVGQATVGSDLDSQAGYTLVSDAPVIVKDLDTETRFHGPTLLFDHGVVSGMSVIIRGRKEPFGVLGLHTRHRRDFTQDEIDFLTAVANILAAAIEQNKVEKALSASEMRYRTITGMVTDFAYVAYPGENSHLIIEWQSGDLAERLGYTTENLTVERWVKILHPHDLPVFEQHINRLKQGKPSHYQVRVYDAFGAIHWLQINALPVFNGQEIIYGAIVDITARKEAEEKIRQLNMELEQRVVERTAQITAVNKELEAFSYSVSHDLRTPLRALDGYSMALLEDYLDVLDEEGQFYLQRIRHASQNMGQLIDDLLNLSRLTRSDLNVISVDLSQLVQDVADKLYNTDAQRSVEFVIEPGLKTWGDARLLQVMFENLLGNAWKFTSQNAHTRIEFGFLLYNNQQVYFIRDNGAGFNMDYVGKLFGAFQRLHSAEEFEGTGIGLATVQRIIHRHGGKIWAEGEVEQGATFYFTLLGMEPEIEEVDEQGQKNHFAS